MCLKLVFREFEMGVFRVSLVIEEGFVLLMVKKVKEFKWESCDIEIKILLLKFNYKFV